MTEKETRYYQYLHGDKRGQIVQSTGITELGNLMFINFDDGERCNIDLVGSLDDTSAFETKKVIAEITDPNNIWRFEKNPDIEQLKLDKELSAVGEDGQYYDIANPYEGTKLPDIIGIPPKNSKHVSYQKAYKKVEKAENSKDIKDESLEGRSTIPDEPRGPQPSQTQETLTRERAPLGASEHLVDVIDSVELDPSLMGAIQSILDNCKRTLADIELELELQLIPLDTYKFIHENFDLTKEDAASLVQNHIIKSLNLSEIFKEIKRALDTLYLEVDDDDENDLSEDDE